MPLQYKTELRRALKNLVEQNNVNALQEIRNLNSRVSKQYIAIRTRLMHLKNYRNLDASELDLMLQTYDNWWIEWILSAENHDQQNIIIDFRHEYRDAFLRSAPVPAVPNNLTVGPPPYGPEDLNLGPLLQLRREALESKQNLARIEFLELIRIYDELFWKPWEDMGKTRNQKFVVTFFRDEYVNSKDQKTKLPNIPKGLPQTMPPNPPLDLAERLATVYT